MYYGLLALLTRALRMDARQLRNHLFRLAFVSFIYVCLLAATLQSSLFGAPGLMFFKQIVWLNVLFITCIGIGFFSSAITEEKEEDTIGLLQMAGLNHLGILFGKSTSRMIQVGLLLIVQFPFMLLAITLGGVTRHQVVAAYVDLLAYTILLANVGLLCSVIFKRGGFAAAATTMMMVAYVLGPIYANLQLATAPVSGWTHGIWWQSWALTLLNWLSQSCVVYEINDVVTTGYAKPILNTQVVSNCVVGLVGFGLSWILFEPCVNRVDSKADSRGVLLRSTARRGYFSPGRCWSNPFMWKDFQFICGGLMIMVTKFSLYVGVAVVIVVIALTPQNWFGWSMAEAEAVYFLFMLGATVLESCIYASRIFHDEIRLHTMSALLMLPRPIGAIGYSKVIGCILGLIPALICLAASFLSLPTLNRTTFITGAVDPRLWAAFMTFLIFLHLIALLSLFFKWGALPAAIFMMGPVSLCCPVGNIMILVADRNTGIQSIWGELPATFTIWILTGLVCFVFQMMIAARLQELGTK